MSPGMRTSSAWRNRSLSSTNTTVVGCEYGVIDCSLIFGPREQQREPRIDTEFGFAGNRPAESVHHHLAETETDAGSVARLGRRIEAFEYAFEVLRQDPGAGIFDDDRVRIRQAADDRYGQFALAGLVHVVDAVLQEIEQHVHHEHVWRVDDEVAIE